MHVNPVKLEFKKNNLFQYTCFTAHVNSVLHPTNNFKFNLKRIFTNSQLTPLIQQSGRQVLEQPVGINALCGS